MGRKVTNEIKDEPGEPMVARSKMGEASVSESDIKGIEDLTEMEKKHLLLQLARDRVKDSSAGPWEITDIRRDEWRGLKNTLAQPTGLTQPVEIDLRDIGRNVLLEVLIDITKLERELEAQKTEVKDLEVEKHKNVPKE